MSATFDNATNHEDTPVLETAVISPEGTVPVPEHKDGDVPAVEEPTSSAEVNVSSDVEAATSPEEGIPTSEDQPAVEAVVVTQPTDIEPTDDSKDIQNGALFKRGPRPLRLWKNRYFAFHSGPIPLDQLRLVSKKYTKAVSANKEEYEKVNSSLFHDIASATVSGEGLLFYYKSSNPDHIEVPLGIINLNNIESISLIKASKPYAFSIKTHSREYVLAASTADEAKSWVHSIQAKIDSIANMPNLSETPQYRETYDNLISRQAFNPKTTPPLPTGILSDNEILSGSDNEVENHDTDHQTPVVAKESDQTPADLVLGDTTAAADAHGVQPESPTLKSMFVNFKSFINKKTEKPTDVTAHTSEVSEAQPVSSEPSSLPDTAPNVAEETTHVETSEEQVVKDEPPSTEGKKEEHPARPLSFHLPKFFKGLMKEEKPETVVDQTETPTPETEVVANTLVTEVVANSPAAVVEETPAAASEEHEPTSDQLPEAARPESPFKRSISSFLHLKKGKQTELPSDSAEVELNPPVSESDNLEKPLEIVDNIGEAATAPIASNEEQTPADDATEKPKKPTLFKRLSSMVRPITTPKASPQPPAETNTPVIAELSEEPTRESSNEQLPTVEAVKAN